MRAVLPNLLAGARLGFACLVLALLPSALSAQAAPKPGSRPTAPAPKPQTTAPKPQATAAKPAATQQSAGGVTEAASFDEDGRDVLKYESDAWVAFVADCEAGKAAEIEAQLERGDLKPSLRNGIRRTMLHQAALADQAEVVRVLLAQGLDVNASDSLYGYTPLHEAARKGNVAVLGILITAGAKLNARDRNAATALHAAIGNNQLEAAKVLLEGGCDANARDGDGASALHYAVQVNDPAALSLLLAHQANPNARTNESWDLPGNTTPLHLAAASGELALVRLLVEAGADVNAADADGKKPLNLAYETGADAVVAYLRSNGAKI